MRRRSFLQGAASVSLMLATTPGVFFRKARARDTSLPKYLMTFSADGAWDMSCLADPKGGEPYSSHYENEHILSVPGTEITYAPQDVVDGNPTGYRVGPEGAEQDFFLKYGADLLVLRGVDTQTNSHDIGPRHVFSGNIRTGTPALGALYAATHEADVGRSLPMSFVSTGGFDNTENLLPPARVGNIFAFKDLAKPYLIYPNGTSAERYFPAEVEDLVRASQQARHQRRYDEETLPKVRSAMEQLDRARSAEPGFDPLYDVLKGLPALSAAEAANPLIAKAQVAIAAMASGQSVAANLTFGTFDTHQNHDALHRGRMLTLLQAVDYTRRTLAEMGLWDDTIFMIGSDFSRTIYNGPPEDPTRGKDHWPITHLLVMGKGVSGGRVVGETDEGLNPDGTRLKGPRARKVKQVAGEVVLADDNDPDAAFLRPPDIHAVLRDHFGIRAHPLATKYPAGDSTLPLLPLLS